MVTITNASNGTYRGKDAIIRSVELAMKKEKLIGQVNIILINDKAMRKLHKTWFGTSSATDVITFAIEPERPILGEIYISLDTAKQQAKDYGVSVTNELCRLAVHGTLHLAGYTDSTEIERQRMHVRENLYIVDR